MLFNFEYMCQLRSLVYQSKCQVFISFSKKTLIQILNQFFIHYSIIIINNMTTESSPQRSTLQNLVNETQKMRSSLYEARQEKQEILRNLRKAEAENRAMDIRLKTIESERQRDLNENRRFMENLEQQKKQKIKLLTELSEAKNLLTRKDAEIAQLKSQCLSLQTENQRLYKQVQTSTQQQVTAIRDRQNTINQVKILETKHEAAQMEKKLLANRVAQVEGQLHRVKDELGVVTRKYQQRQFGVQAIYKDEQVTKDRLLEQFQSKMSRKDEETRQQIQKYLNENSLLKQKIIELKGSLY